MALSEGIELAAQLIAPGDTPKEQRRWRLLISVFIIALLGHMVWSCGYLKFMGWPGFATSSEVTKIMTLLDEHGKHLDSIDAEAMERALIETRQQECEASKKSEYFKTRIAQLEGQYTNAMKHEFDLPSCDEFR